MDISANCRELDKSGRYIDKDRMFNSKVYFQLILQQIYNAYIDPANLNIFN